MSIDILLNFNLLLSIKSSNLYRFKENNNKKKYSIILFTFLLKSYIL